jgi:hypothetical protein
MAFPFSGMSWWPACGRDGAAVLLLSYGHHYSVFKIEKNPCGELVVAKHQMVVPVVQVHGNPEDLGSSLTTTRAAEAKNKN